MLRFMTSQESGNIGQNPGKHPRIPPQGFKGANERKQWKFITHSNWNSNESEWDSRLRPKFVSHLCKPLSTAMPPLLLDIRRTPAATG
ncbi:hypothetical protein DdX_11251 [Ditylenchus destructor]|uniref:Uncharacterized protein n=1 Tax=Ditylenchus destructor TaxID=166010 RepID=A0AAD4MXP5_9BILA|nr:hypothetical protein DdX_11251 [Ditylenchus destructor]